MKEEQFFARVRKVESTGCWEWDGARSGKYRMLLFRGKMMGAHRASWIIANGPIPDGLWVLHRCDNPPCVNPDHLFIGTSTDNNRDMVAKGRNVPPEGMRHWAAIDPSRMRGERNGAAKLTREQVDAIKVRLARGERSSNLAREYRVCVGTITAIKLGKNWGDKPAGLFRSLSRVVEAFGHSRTLREWSRIYGISAKTIAARISYGWSHEDAVSLPLRNASPRKAA